MSRYIEQESIGKTISNLPTEVFQTENRIDLVLSATEAIDAIKDAPSIDICFCRECKWRKTDNSCDLNCRIEYLDGTETDMWFYVKPDDFCSYGEREGS